MTVETKSTTTRTDSHVFAFPTLLEPGAYHATFAGAHEVTYQDKTTKDDQTLVVWSFTLDDVESDEGPVVVEGVSSLLLSARAKGFAWLRAIAPDVVRDRNEVDASELVGRRCIVVVDVTDEGDSKVMDVLPPVTGASA